MQKYVLDEVVGIHAKTCSCVFADGYGLVSVGSSCAEERMAHISNNPQRPQHTRKTSGRASINRERRSYLRGRVATAQEKDAAAELLTLTSEEYERQNVSRNLPKVWADSLLGR